MSARHLRPAYTARRRRSRAKRCRKYPPIWSADQGRSSRGASRRTPRLERARAEVEDTLALTKDPRRALRKLGRDRRGPVVPVPSREGGRRAADRRSVTRRIPELLVFRTAARSALGVERAARAATARALGASVGEARTDRKKLRRASARPEWARAPTRSRRAASVHVAPDRSTVFPRSQAARRGQGDDHERDSRDDAGLEGNVAVEARESRILRESPR